MTATVHQLRPMGSPDPGPGDIDRAIDVELVQALRDMVPDAGARLFDRHGAYIERLLFRILGPDEELEDTLHDVFTKALTTHSQLRDPAALKAWLSRIAAGTARDLIRKRMRRRWLILRDPHEMPEEGRGAQQEASELLARVYRVIRRMKPDERVAFTLRRIEGMTLPEVAAACGVSLATVKRRLTKAAAQFRRLAAAGGVLEARLQAPVEGGPHE